MSNDKRKKKTFVKTHEVNSKMQLLQALKHLNQDIAWIPDLIETLDQIDFPDDSFELSGLVRKICYELIRENPDLFTNNDPKTLALKTVLYNALAQVKVKRSRELFTKMMEKIVNELRKKSYRNHTRRI